MFIVFIEDKNFRIYSFAFIAADFSFILSMICTTISLKLVMQTFLFLMIRGLDYSIALLWLSPIKLLLVSKAILVMEYILVLKNKLFLLQR